MREKSNENETTPLSPSEENAMRAEQEMKERIAALKREFDHISRTIVSRNATQYDDLHNEDIYQLHSRLVVKCANAVLAKQGRKFVIDDNNRDVLRFLLYYFNNCDKALEIFPQCDLNKCIFLFGKAGVGKTVIMDSFSLYLKETKNPRAFYSTSQTQMLNYYRQHNSIDKFTFNENNTKSFEGEPVNICLNDLGLKTQKFYGTDMQMLIEEFLYARYEIWTSQGKFVHITTNLDRQDITDLFKDNFERLTDRLKMFNVIPINGESRR